MRCPRQVVLDPVAGRIFSGTGPLSLGIDHRHIAAFGRIGKVQTRAYKPLIEKPDTPCIAPGWLGADHGLNFTWPGGHKEMLENGEVQPFIFQGKSEVAL